MIELEYEEGFIGEVAIYNFENERESLQKQSRRFDIRDRVELSPGKIKAFLEEKGFDLSQNGAVFIRSFDNISDWHNYPCELGDWLINPEEYPEPTHPDEIVYSTEYLRGLK